MQDEDVEWLAFVVGGKARCAKDGRGARAVRVWSLLVLDVWHFWD